ncbi:MAG: response regulator [Gammaproteobacteria bacterium]|nr:response regulator [Gammaproteobacteria bacterium]
MIVILLMVGALIIWSGISTYRSFVAAQTELARSATSNAAAEIGLYIKELRRAVGIFAREQNALIGQLANDPDSPDLYDSLRTKVAVHFPDFISINVTDLKGVPLVYDIGAEVGDLCKLNIREFLAQREFGGLRIHPAADGHHFDVMALWSFNANANANANGGGVESGALFVSFRTDTLARILEGSAPPRTQLFLTLSTAPGLIEVAASGSRDQLRRDIELAPEEIQRVTSRRVLPDTQWELYAVPEPELYAAEYRRVVTLNLGVFLGFLAVTLAMFWLVRREVQTRDEAVRVSRQKSEFLSTMSHEIRTPLNSVIGFAELLSKTNLDSRQREYLSSVRHSGEALLALLNDILDLSKIEAGKLQLELIEFDLREWIEHTLIMFSEQAAAKGIELCSVVPHDLPVLLRGDPAHLRQVLVNLVGNAVKFTERGFVSVQVERAGEVIDSGPNRGRAVYRITVLDTGIGIDPARKEQLFEQFSQADSSTTRRYGGTGLGLAISRRLVELMGGHIDVDPRARGGSEFWFTFVCDVVEDAARGDASPLRGRRALVLTDRNCLAEGMGQSLGVLGVEYRVSSDGPAALTLLRQARAEDGGDEHGVIDVALIDTALPVEAGFDFARVLRSDHRLRHIPVLLLCAASDEWRVLRAIGELPGAETAADGDGVAVVHKPVVLEQLHERLALALGVADVAALAGENAEVDFAGLRVLVVDDNELNLRVARGMLEQLGCEATPVHGGHEALKRIADKDFDLVLMDSEMPGMDGTETLGRIRKLDRSNAREARVVVAMTANSGIGDRERYLEAGFDDYLPKPITLDSMASMITHWFSSRSVQAARASGEAETPQRDREPVVDVDVLRRMRALQSENDPTFFRELLAGFRSEAPERLRVVRNTVADPGSLRQALHSLKGTAALIGARRLAAACEEGLVDARAGDLSQVDIHVEQLAAELDWVLEELSRYEEELESP